MPRIGLLSDTHSYLDEKVFSHFEDCDEIWHAGDFGTYELSKKLSDFKPLIGVYGNIDGRDIKNIHPEDARFEREGLKIWMTHICGYPGKYNPRVRELLKTNPPNILICGHSHILRVMTDKANNNLLFINPGAAGREGFHKVRTIMKFDIREGKVSEMKVIELGKK